MKTDKHIEKWLNGTLNEEELKQFEETETYKELIKLSDSLKYFKAPDYDTEKELKRFNTNKTKEGRQVKIKWQKTLLRVAAMLTLVVGSYLYYTYFVPETIETSIAESREIVLPDSSIVIMNAVSKISYNVRKWNKTRELELIGEAFFKVRKGSKFDVKTSEGTISVLGTQFNVKQRKDFFEVVCFEGLVSVQTPFENNELPANHTIRIINGKVFMNQFSEGFEPAWINNESAFTSVPFRQVISEFERQYDVDILPQNVNMDQIFTGRFTHKDMVLALKSITIPQNISYQITEDRQIILSGEIE